ncbi:Smr/MutS family protein [Chloroflexota bacterium]
MYDKDGYVLKSVQGHNKQGEGKTSMPPTEVHLRRMTVDNALIKLDKYLDDAFMAGLYQVRVVHGKGTGTLRQAVHKVLSRHTLVESFRIGGYGEGGEGVTVVELARR